jgi:hypothetical protein
MGIMFLITGTGLLTVSVLARSQWLLAVTCLVIGVQVECAGPPAGVIDITLGVLLLLALWNRRRRRRGRPAAVGAKARAARDALVRPRRARAPPLPAMSGQAARVRTATRPGNRPPAPCPRPAWLMEDS